MQTSHFARDSSICGVTGNLGKLLSASKDVILKNQFSAVDYDGIKDSALWRPLGHGTFIGGVAMPCGRYSKIRFVMTKACICDNLLFAQPRGAITHSGNKRRILIERLRHMIVLI